MSISSIGSNASQIWQQHRESRTQQAGSTNGANTTQRPGRGSFSGVPVDADSSTDGASVSAGTSASTGAGSISRPASKLIADVNSLLISLQAGNTAAGAAPASSNAGTAAGPGAASAGRTATAADGGAASISSAGSVSQDQLAGLSTVLNDLSKVHGGGHHHHGHGASSSASSSADAGGTGAGAIPGASAASASQPASNSASSDLLAQLGKALSAYVRGQASATSQPSTVIAA